MEMTKLVSMSLFGNMDGVLQLVLPLALMFGLMYLLLIRPQKKKEKKLREQINAMAVGDNVVTIGGIVGRVVNIKDDEVTISTSVANTLMTFKKSAVNTVIKPSAD
jgi:preprotein translocase subunit YajC